MIVRSAKPFLERRPHPEAPSAQRSELGHLSDAPSHCAHDQRERTAGAPRRDKVAALPPRERRVPRPSLPPPLPSLDHEKEGPVGIRYSLFNTQWSRLGVRRSMVAGTNTGTGVSFAADGPR